MLAKGGWALAMVEPGMLAKGGWALAMVEPGMLAKGGWALAMVEPGMLAKGGWEPGMVEPGKLANGGWEPGIAEPGMLAGSGWEPGMLANGPGMAEPGVLATGGIEPALLAGKVEAGILEPSMTVEKPGSPLPGTVVFHPSAASAKVFHPPGGMLCVPCAFGEKAAASCPGGKVFGAIGAIGAMEPGPAVGGRAVGGKVAAGGMLMVSWGASLHGG
eukprot:TRINITY_DN2356_c0_g2_i2.p2 TRINITY_DN2356_c0_g2~~TRINITY_DN2356_c0_g2_i2.p2  ORF type:complete len:216 (-),score=63.38 TRINITY_DN2356_c0_g2_i2:47-694(-)